MYGVSMGLGWEVTGGYLHERDVKDRYNDGLGFCFGYDPEEFWREESKKYCWSTHDSEARIPTKVAVAMGLRSLTRASSYIWGEG